MHERLIHFLPTLTMLCSKCRARHRSILRMHCISATAYAGSAATLVVSSASL
eukprot:SAG11_NODE_21238_length_429_cov_0.624242_1_plen_51_part_01